MDTYSRNGQLIAIVEIMSSFTHKFCDKYMHFCKKKNIPYLFLDKIILSPLVW